MRKARRFPRFVLYAVPEGGGEWVPIGQAHPFKDGRGFMLDFRLIPENARIALKAEDAGGLDADAASLFSFADTLDGKVATASPKPPKGSGRG